MANGSIEAELSYGTFDDLIASAFYSDWSSNVLKNGTTQKSFTIEKTLDRDAPAADEFHRFSGVVVNTLGLTITAQQLVTASFGVMGKGVTRGAAPITGATYQAAGTEDILSAATDFANLTIAGLGASPAVQSIQLSLTNNLRQRPVVGSVDSAGLGEGQFALTGTLNAYFEDPALYDAFLNNTAASLSFLMGTVSGKRYLVEVPRFKIQTMPITASGRDQDVMANIAFQALYDSTTGCTARLTRAQ